MFVCEVPITARLVFLKNSLLATSHDAGYHFQSRQPSPCPATPAINNQRMIIDSFDRICQRKLLTECRPPKTNQTHAPDANTKASQVRLSEPAGTSPMLCHSFTLCVVAKRAE